VGRRQLAPDTFELAFHSPRIAAAARPGQFVNILLPAPPFGYRVFDGPEAWADAPAGTEPTLIRRPFSIAEARASEEGGEADTVEVLVKVVGRGTRLLATLRPEAEVWVLGPLGNTFDLPEAGAAAILVAGGCGWAGLAMLARALRERGHPTYAFIGAATVDDLPLETADGRRPESFLDALPEVCVTSRELEALGVTVALAAEAGGRVYGGVVSELLEQFLQRREASGARVYACGPWLMLREVARLAAAAGCECQVSLEERMACGIGVCSSCVVEVVVPGGGIGHKKLCVDGPVLDAAEVHWEGKSG
ncbi:MAG: hypothetical protein ACODAJ_11485, partial [Planctomycetota bacterium]